MSLLTLVFDFDGTLADTMLAYGQAWNQVAEGFGLRKISTDEIKRLRHEHHREIMKYLGLSALKLPKVARSMRRELNRNIERLQYFPGIREALQELKARGHPLGILTSNSRDNVDKFLKARDLELFDFIYTGSRMLGKATVIRFMLRKHGLSSDQAVYVCDEVRDLEAARKVGLKVVSVTWGFNSRQALERESPDALVDRPEELLEILDRLSGS